jgi:hypothetical protein
MAVNSFARFPQAGEKAEKFDSTHSFWRVAVNHQLCNAGKKQAGMACTRNPQGQQTPTILYKYTIY